MMRLFDFDGTLVDSNGVWEEIDLEFLGRRGLAPTRAYSDAVGHSIFPLAARFTRDYYHLDLTPEEIMGQWMDLAREAYAHQVPLKPGAREFLEQCRKRGERMALLTACVRELCQAALARHSLAPYFDQILFVEDLGITKQDPGAFPLLLERLGARPDQCVMYEDSPGACAAARAAGLEVVGVYDPFYAHREGELRQACHRYIRSFTELLE